MIDAALEVAYKHSLINKQRQDITEKLADLSLDQLEKVAFGGALCASSKDNSDEWIVKFRNTPLYEQALQLEQRSLQIEQQRLQESMEREAREQQRPASWLMQDQLHLQRKMLDLQHEEMLNGGGASEPAPEAPPAVPPQETKMASYLARRGFAPVVKQAGFHSMYQRAAQAAESIPGHVQGAANAIGAAAGGVAQAVPAIGKQVADAAQHVGGGLAAAGQAVREAAPEVGQAIKGTKDALQDINTGIQQGKQVVQEIQQGGQELAGHLGIAGKPAPAYNPTDLALLGLGTAGLGVGGGIALNSMRKESALRRLEKSAFFSAAGKMLKGSYEAGTAAAKGLGGLEGLGKGLQQGIVSFGRKAAKDPTTAAGIVGAGALGVGALGYGAGKLT